MRSIRNIKQNNYRDDEDLMKVIPITSFVILSFEIKSKINT